MRPSLLCLTATLLLTSSALPAAAPLPAWAGRAPNGDVVRIAVTPPENKRFEHLAWPKAVRTADGTIVLGFLAGTHHGNESCPAVSISKDGGKTFSAVENGCGERQCKRTSDSERYVDPRGRKGG